MDPFWKFLFTALVLAALYWFGFGQYRFLNRRFRHDGIYRGRKIAVRAYFHSQQWKSSLWLGADAEGLYIEYAEDDRRRAWSPMRVPWSSIMIANPFSLGKIVPPTSEIILGRICEISLPRDIAEELLQMAGQPPTADQRWRRPRARGDLRDHG